MRRLIIVLLMPFVFFAYGWAQWTISGSVLTSEKEALAGAYVEIPELSINSVTDADGRFNLKDIPTGKHTLTISFIGYYTYSETIDFSSNLKREIVLSEKIETFEEVVVSAVRAQKNTPTTFTIIQKKDIEKMNFGQDAPFMLAQEPSVVVTSDAGTGIGYTGMRIRGSDSRKINVTINGVPMNDPESHGVFWVDVPDIASSAQSIQIQRGVGTSTNGSGAFGGSINLQTDNFSQKAFYEYTGAAGSFNTLKNSLHVGTGLINNHWFLEGKVTGIKSDGYIKRGWSDLKSYFAQIGYYSKKDIVKLVAFGGWEETYQAWYGVTAEEMDRDRRYNAAGYISGNGDSALFYDQMIDHYQQDHFQLHYIHTFSENLKFNIALHYTYGRGYYQDYVPGWYPLSMFGLPSQVSGNDTIEYTDVIQRLWLDNDFYGTTWGLNYASDRFSLTWGGAANKFDNDHFGQVMWARYFLSGLPGKHFYDNNAVKKDWNTFIKLNYKILDPLTLFVDLQLRNINYKAAGLNREYNDQVIDIDKSFSFFNPKAGLLFAPNQSTSVYFSYAMAHREPTRDDYLSAAPNEEPKAEILQDYELGSRYSINKFFSEVTLYYMNYTDQLVLTGELNSVGTPKRKNVGKSYRAGLELLGGLQLSDMVKIDLNATFSRNKTDFIESVSDSFIKHNNVDLAFSPKLIMGSKLTIVPVKGIEAMLSFKYVDKQFLDNTMSDKRKLDSYGLIDFMVSYNRLFDKTSKVTLSLKVNNVLDKMYISNGRVSSGTPYYYPQAGRNFLASLSVRF